jgi:hypothetical protein
MPDENPSAEELQEQANESGGRQWNAWEGDAEYTKAQEAAAAKGNPPAITDPGVDLSAAPQGEVVDDPVRAREMGLGVPADRSIREQERRVEAGAARELEQQQRAGAREDDGARRQAVHDAKQAEKPAEDAVKRETKRADKKD